MFAVERPGPPLHCFQRRTGRDALAMPDEHPSQPVHIQEAEPQTALG
jgi:hypothetical protein